MTTNLQLYLALGFPTVVIGASLIVSLVEISGLRSDLACIREDIRDIRADMREIRSDISFWLAEPGSE